MFLHWKKAKHVLEVGVLYIKHDSSIRISSVPEKIAHFSWAFFDKTLHKSSH